MKFSNAPFGKFLDYAFPDRDDASNMQVLASRILQIWAFEHPPRGEISNNNNPNTRNGYQQNNRYQPGGGRPQQADIPYSLDKAQIVTDLSSERPQWILSAYGPGRNAPAQLFGGPAREQSFEEMRLIHYMSMAQGNPQKAIQDAENLYHNSEQQMQNALRNVDGAINFIINAQNDHPNRIDVAQGNPFNQQNSAQSTTSNPLAAPAQTPGPAFEAPSQSNSAFGQPSQPSAFGQPSGGPAFGQTPTLGQKPNPFATQTTPAFGQSTSLGGGTFGQPSTLGQKPNPFGAPSGSSAFGRDSNAPSPFSAGVTTSNPFAQGNSSTANPPFGAPSQPATSNPFAPSATSNPFGDSAPAAPFGTPSAQPVQPAFGGPSQPLNANPFSPAQAPSQSPFGQLPTVAPTQSNPFGSQPANSNPFAPAASLNNNADAAGQAFGLQPAAPPQSMTNGTSGNTDHPPISSYSSKDMSGRLTMFKGRRVTYRDNVPGVMNMDGSWSKIWFPEGGPPLYKDTELDDTAYDESTKATYLSAKQTGSFQDGVMPMLPPKREWCTWDF